MHPGPASRALKGPLVGFVWEVANGTGEVIGIGTRVRTLSREQEKKFPCGREEEREEKIGKRKGRMVPDYSGAV